MSIEPPGAPEVANPSTMGFCLAISAVTGDQQNASSGRKLHITSHVTSVKTPIKIRLPHDEISHNAPTQICHRCSGTSMVTDDNHHRYSVHRSYAQQRTTPKVHRTGLSNRLPPPHNTYHCPPGLISQNKRTI